MTSCFISYILSNQVWWCNIKWFLSYSKHYTCKFMQANSRWHHKLFHFHLSFCIWKVWRRRKKITRIRISRERKELFRWNKKHFTVFEVLLFGEKIKIWQKIVDTTFKFWIAHRKSRVAQWISRVIHLLRVVIVFSELLFFGLYHSSSLLFSEIFFIMSFFASFCSVTSPILAHFGPMFHFYTS